MSSIRHAHIHSHHSPPHVKKVAVKAARSASASKIALAPKTTIKGIKTPRKVKEEEEEVVNADGDNDDDDDDDMDSSFLQFCAMCEKQIVVPNSSILYCSESCRRRDVSTTDSDSSLKTLGGLPSMTSFCNDASLYSSKVPTYVPALQPTPRTIPDGRIPTKFHNGKSDLDPTEWKPADPNATERKSQLKPGEWKPKLTHRPSSEASSYLNKFHHSSSSLTSKRRPMVGHSGTTVSSCSTPGLSHTPTASTSSEESLTEMPYEFVARPAISMPTESATKSIAGIKDGDDFTYEKKNVRTSLGSASGSLKKLLEHSTGGT